MSCVDIGICCRRTTTSSRSSKRASVHSRSWCIADCPCRLPTCADVTSPSKNRSSPRRNPRTTINVPDTPIAASARIR